MKSERLLAHPAALCNMFRRVAIDAGDIIMKYFDGYEENTVERKSDGSPVTLADRAAETFIKQAIHEITPDIPMIGEESTAAGDAPVLDGDYFWMVDALDGTAGFAEGGEDFTVNIALIHKGVPILGIVYLPVKGVLYAAHGPETAIRWSKDNDNDRPIRVRSLLKEGLTVIRSARDHGDAARMEKFLEGFKVEKILKRSSSLKFCLIAEGAADLYPRFGKTSEWDTAAGEAILRAAGGFVMNFNGKPLMYGTNRHFANPEFVAASFNAFETQPA